MFNLAKWVLSMYIPLVAKMVEDSPFLMATRVNFKLICDVDLLISLSCLMLMLETFHGLIKFAHKKDVFVCDYVVAIKICQGQPYIHYSDLTTKCTYDVFKKLHDLVDCIDNTMHMKWKQSSLDLNTLGVEYLCFDFAGFIFWVTCLDAMAKRSKCLMKFSTFLWMLQRHLAQVFLFLPILNLYLFKVV
jgi:hypothetical protein